MKTKKVSEGSIVVKIKKRVKENIAVETKKMKKTDVAKMVGKTLAEKALKAGVKAVAFDRGAYRYHGRVKALAEAAREGGLIL